MIKNMAKATPLLFFLPALLCHLHTGDAQHSCSSSDLTWAVIKTGNVVQGQTEYQVVFKTPCPCPFKDVRVWCGGVEDSAVPLDPRKVEVFEGMCVLKQPIARGSPLYFTYTSKVPVNFRVFSAAASPC